MKKDIFTFLCVITCMPLWLTSPILINCVLLWPYCWSLTSFVFPYISVCYYSVFPYIKCMLLWLYILANVVGMSNSMFYMYILFKTSSAIQTMFLLFYILSDNFIYITNCMLKQLDLQSIFTQLLYILKLMSL